jgi:hypothetical protein
MRNRQIVEVLPGFFSALLAKELDDSVVKFGGPCKPISSIWLMVMTMLVDGAGVHEDSAQCRGSKLSGPAGKNVIINTLNFLLHSFSPLPSFIPPSGIELDFDAYVNDPSSHHKESPQWGLDLTRHCCPVYVYLHFSY